MFGLLLVSTVVKLLLIPAYRSTDFEVHRNWLAITHSLPLNQWYTEATSIWTLDYPPFFAWFEKWWSLWGQWFDPAMLDIQNLNYDSNSTILFQRLTVIASDLVLYLALKRYVQSFGKRNLHLLVAGSILMHPGLLIVDHMHFQYNGFLYGILVLSIVEAKRDHLLTSGILFAVLLNFKHIYLYMAPAYFVYLLKAYCFTEKGFSFTRFFTLGGSVIGVFAVSLGPFFKQLPQLASRLFPFTRGLCHAYWAPNFWALYAAADRVLIPGKALLAKHLGWHVNIGALGSMTRGYVGDTQFAVLPNVEAIHTILITLAVVLWKLWQKPTFTQFVSATTLCGFASFLFGWHVHEKAILIVLIPYSLIATQSKLHLRTFVILSGAGICSLYPLLFQTAETPVKLLITAVWALVVVPGFAHFSNINIKGLLISVDVLYLLGLAGLQLYTAAHPLLFGERYEFLPLLVTSVYCGAGIMYGWALAMMAYFLQG
ncbi:glycosyltransferase family 57 protein [Syncephalastrum racemosum]|uniref:Alpha-1,3-glucosyltransferase n=1 Tax=Syncephalastrum racemosum TaxID=13706 RepID=A0A1X2HBI5_SYNRA|nr:glycosyltransferase family 57 protein [Syncephalastrum racemosum]